MEIPDPNKATTHLFVAPGIDKQKTEDEALRRSLAGETVMIHHHSGREDCLYTRPDDPAIVADHKIFSPPPESDSAGELSRIHNDPWARLVFYLLYLL
jgi:hypothetical protein